MATEAITLEVSQDILAALKMGATDLGQQIRLLAAIPIVRCMNRFPFSKPLLSIVSDTIQHFLAG
ncbi:hypothetical protein [Thermoleptolyngbya sp. C42_A2020_037]|uniref:hypothetical protein n=1 Tax=Thermoleptolyngbya sp. C42_A2020_037 TaxID=2747799 RepID=UPI0019E9EA1B|nr:hypothetical protein [Thermoleptolyngbya sp. C42_A2020_037]MBF2083898.1 hypothetical protein [Thermoleptolyngbya sp. C42_A2020_037]